MAMTTSARAATRGAARSSPSTRRCPLRRPSGTGTGDGAGRRSARRTAGVVTDVAPTVSPSTLPLGGSTTNDSSRGGAPCCWASDQISAKWASATNSSSAGGLSAVPSAQISSTRAASGLLGIASSSGRRTGSNRGVLDMSPEPTSCSHAQVSAGSASSEARSERSPPSITTPLAVDWGRLLPCCDPRRAIGRAEPPLHPRPPRSSFRTGT